MTTQEK
jgi:hypothetical protein